MADHEAAVRNRINESVFAKRNATGEGPQESYAGHLKIWESEGGNDKPRYIILSSMYIYMASIYGCYKLHYRNK